jgi:ferrous iron transport protein B
MSAWPADAFRFALVGNPNCGKTALFNMLTGKRQKVANYPGVTVESKRGRLVSPEGRKMVVVDLPGTYSLRGRSPDEAVTRNAILGQLADERGADLIVCVADATNLRLSLRLALELKTTGIPVVLSLNMVDIAKARGITIDMARLSEKIGMPVIPTIAVEKDGTQALLAALDAFAEKHHDSLQPSWHEQSADEVRASHRFINDVIAECVTIPPNADLWTRRIDNVLLHPFWGLLVLLLVLFLIFQAVFSWSTPAMDAIKDGFDFAGDWVKTHLPEGMLSSLLADGVIAGVGSVIVFLPQILVLFFFIILLEDFGYMARAAFLMDRIIGGVGLHGRSFIPLLSSFACAIPGIMATRVIDNRRQRLATILIAPLMTCSARIPVYTLIIAAFIPNTLLYGFINLQGVVMFGLYAVGIVSAFLVAWVFRLFVWSGKSEPFIMELPSYKRPSLRSVGMNVVQRGFVFLQRAGTTILSMMVLIWFLASVPGAPEGATDPAINYSFAGMIGHALHPLLAPIGFNWQIAVALIPGMAAREVAVGALATVYALGNDESSLGSTIAVNWSLGTALALLAWYVFAPQCASTLSVVRRETNSWKWPVAMFAYLTALAYVAAFVTFHVTEWLSS